MAIELSTNDCGSLSDSDLEAIARLGEFQGIEFDVGFLSKQRDDWVLNALAVEEGEMLGAMFFTLERIGGTPCILINLASTKPSTEEKVYLYGLLKEAYARALLAFPDEDVLVGAKLVSPNAYDLFAGLTDIIPRPGHKPSGEERAWTRRLAKRFCIDGELDDRNCHACASDEPFGLIAYRLKDDPDNEFSAVFERREDDSSSAVVVFGWAMAEDLSAGSLPEVVL